MLTAAHASQLGLMAAAAATASARMRLHSARCVHQCAAWHARQQYQGMPQALQRRRPSALVQPGAEQTPRGGAGLVPGLGADRALGAASVDEPLASGECSRARRAAAAISCTLWLLLLLRRVRGLPGASCGHRCTGVRAVYCQIGQHHSCPIVYLHAVAVQQPHQRRNGTSRSKCCAAVRTIAGQAGKCGSRLVLHR